ncbi:malate synthase [Oceanobacillus piezotolerans]|uniref:Malate synthase n=1 Tax=Oceanobacillus piezotolerans TaxID=2448030 RepID=A0A498DCA7_9BACI|nr:malate synthase [Oceanobacillus piezotolerans]RLL43761.1 malate synthase [Oceanobacillus piezotolerans]
MNLINKEVTHRSFGKGNIVKQDDTVIEINFATENKKFLFPDAFGKFLKLNDKEAAHSVERVIQKLEMKRKQEEQEKEEEKELRRREYQRRLEHERLMKNHKLHPSSQMVFWCDDEEQSTFLKEWRVFTGVVKSGNNKGKPNKPSRLHKNSACLLTTRDSSKPEEDRRILGVYMVNENFIGKLCEDGYIPAHAEYRIQLTEQEADKILFWDYYANEKNPEKITWNTGKYRYFDNIEMAQILLDIVGLKSNPEEKELAKNFFEYYCKMNNILEEEVPKPNGALLRV